MLENLFWLLHEFLPLTSINSLSWVNQKLKLVCWDPAVLTKHSNEFIQAGDKITHLSSIINGIQRYPCTVLEVFSDRIDTTFMIRTLRDTDRIAKEGWPFFRLLYIISHGHVICFRDIRLVPLKPGRLPVDQIPGDLHSIFLCYCPCRSESTSRNPSGPRGHAQGVCCHKSVTCVGF